MSYNFGVYISSSFGRSTVVSVSYKSEMFKLIIFVILLKILRTCAGENACKVGQNSNCYNFMKNRLKDLKFFVCVH